MAIKVLVPLLELGWTFEDIGRCTKAQLISAVIVLQRQKIMEAGGQITEDVLKQRPDLEYLWNLAQDEFEKLRED